MAVQPAPDRLKPLLRNDFLASQLLAGCLMGACHNH